MGILTKGDALGKAKKESLDLIEVAPNADPPVARILDFQKFRFQENKKAQAAKKGHDSGLKELWLSPRIAEHDLNTRLRRAEEFLVDGHKVKLTVKFRGREMAHQDVGRSVLDKALAHFGDKIMVEREPKMEGRNLSVIISKGKGTKDAKTEEQ